MHISDLHHINGLGLQREEKNTSDTASGTRSGSTRSSAAGGGSFASRGGKTPPKGGKSPRPATPSARAQEEGQTCPPGYEMSKGRCQKKAATTCPPGLVLSKGRCVPKPQAQTSTPTRPAPTCKAGETLVKNKCVKQAKDVKTDDQPSTTVPDATTVIKEADAAPPKKEESVQPQQAQTNTGSPGVETYTTGGKDTTYTPPTGGGGGGGGGSAGPDEDHVKVMSDEATPLEAPPSEMKQKAMAKPSDTADGSTGSGKLLYGLGILAAFGAWWYFKKRNTR